MGTPADDVVLLTEDLDGVTPFLDPKQPIAAERIAEVAEALGIEAGEVRDRYAALAKPLPITIAA